MTIKIITDSTSDISTEIAQVLGITVVPGYIHFGKQIYRDGIDINNEAFYQQVISSPFHPITSEPTPEDFERVYSDYYGETEGIISIHISKEISKTYNSAIKAAKKMKGHGYVEVVDSRLVSIGLGLVVMEAARLANEGGGMLDILEHINKDISKIRMLGVFNTMKYLVKGERVIMGLYEGVPLVERSIEDSLLPDCITLYKGPIERTCRTPAEIEAEVRLTVLHEVGHFFGLEESQLEQL